MYRIFLCSINVSTHTQSSNCIEHRIAYTASRIQWTENNKSKLENARRALFGWNKNKHIQLVLKTAHTLSLRGVFSVGAQNAQSGCVNAAPDTKVQSTSREESWVKIVEKWKPTQGTEGGRRWLSNNRSADWMETKCDEMFGKWEATQGSGFEKVSIWIINWREWRNQRGVIYKCWEIFDEWWWKCILRCDVD